jgi:hypothetical protein
MSTNSGNLWSVKDYKIRLSPNYREKILDWCRNGLTALALGCKSSEIDLAMAVLKNNKPLVDLNFDSIAIIFFTSKEPLLYSVHWWISHSTWRMLGAPCSSRRVSRRVTQTAF